MRTAFIVAVTMALNLISLGPYFAAPRNAIKEGGYYYEACSCHYGYPGRACVPVVACTTAGADARRLVLSNQSSNFLPHVR